MHGFPGSRVVKNLPANAGDTRDAGSTPGSGRSPGGGNDNPLQYSRLENSIDRVAWQLQSCQGGHKKSDMTEHTHTHTHTRTHTHTVCISPSDQTLQMQLDYKEQRSMKSPVISDLLGK